MSTEKLVEDLGRKISRRGFLKTLGAGAVGALLAVLGSPKDASASHGGCHYYACCCLCKAAGAVTCGTCAWCWTCGPWGPRGDYYQCCECHNTNDGCPTAACGPVKNSYARLLGHAPEREHKQPEVETQK